MREVTTPLDAALRRIGDRWTLLIVASLLEGPRRFGELHQSVPGIATNVLAARLRQLEQQGLAVSRPYSHRPVRLEYQLTAGAAELAGALRLLAAWGAEGGAGGGGGGGGGGPDGRGPDGAPTHGMCGTRLEVRFWCPTCQQVADDDDDEVWV